MNNKTKEIFKELSLNINGFRKSESGFNNSVYLSNNYILKIFDTNSDNIIRYKNELYIYNNLNSNMICKVEESGILNNTPYIFLTRGKGKRVYEVWHTLKDREKEKIIKQIALFLNKLTIIPKPEYIDNYNFFKTLINRTCKSIDLLKDNIDKNLKEQIIEFINKNKVFLSEDKKVIVYPDMHFDNILIDDNCNITTIYDFEDIAYAPSYYVLDTLVRMYKYPHLYANEEDEKNVKPEDYKNIIKWLKKYNPELFNYDNLDIKLKMISLEYDIKQFIKYYKDKDLKNRILEDIN